MIRLEMKNDNMRLTEKQQKYQHYHLEKWINMNILQVKILPSDQRRLIEQAMFTYPPLRKAFEKQIKTIEDQGERQKRHLRSMENN